MTFKIIIAVLFLVIALCRFCLADSLMVAVASNFVEPLAQVSELFEMETGISIQKSVSSTGTLYAQIRNGAPFDLFLAADAKRPDLLSKDGICLESETYARGQVVLWSANPDLRGSETWLDVVSRPDTGRVAIPKPTLAPYGASAIQALVASGMYQKIKDRLIYAGNVAQAFQYGNIGVVDASFTALSFALSTKGKKGVFRVIPGAKEVVQKGCVVKRAKGKEEADRFFEFLLSDKAKKVLKEYGYR